MQDLTGQRFGKLTVKRSYLVNCSRQRRTVCDCVCECGGSKTVVANNLKRGNVLSCGCLRRGPSDIHRGEAILDYLMLNSEVSANEIYSGIGLDVSMASVQSSLRSLERQGKVKRTKGDVWLWSLAKSPTIEALDKGFNAFIFGVAS